MKALCRNAAPEQSAPQKDVIQEASAALLKPRQAGARASVPAQLRGGSAALPVLGQFPLRAAPSRRVLSGTFLNLLTGVRESHSGAVLRSPLRTPARGDASMALGIGTRCVLTSDTLFPAALGPYCALGPFDGFFGGGHLLARSAGEGPGLHLRLVDFRSQSLPYWGPFNGGLLF